LCRVMGRKIENRKTKCKSFNYREIC
jgi:hypothetical protein